MKKHSIQLDFVMGQHTLISFKNKEGKKCFKVYPHNADVASAHYEMLQFLKKKGKS